jgi:hypothetical protein
MIVAEMSKTWAEIEARLKVLREAASDPRIAFSLRP